MQAVCAASITAISLILLWPPVSVGEIAEVIISSGSWDAEKRTGILAVNGNADSNNANTLSDNVPSLRHERLTSGGWEGEWVEFRFNKVITGTGGSVETWISRVMDPNGTGYAPGEIRGRQDRNISGICDPDFEREKREEGHPSPGDFRCQRSIQEESDDPINIIGEPSKNLSIGWTYTGSGTSEIEDNISSRHGLPCIFAGGHCIWSFQCSQDDYKGTGPKAITTSGEEYGIDWQRDEIDSNWQCISPFFGVFIARGTAQMNSIRARFPISSFVSFTSDYIARSQEEREFTPEPPFTVLDDFVVGFQFPELSSPELSQLNDKLVEQFDGKEVKLVAELEEEGSVMELHVTSMNCNKSIVNADGTPLRRCEALFLGSGGTQSGLSGVTGKNLHIVSDLIHRKASVYAYLELPNGGQIKINVPMTTCYHYWGPSDAKFRLGYLATYLNAEDELEILPLAESTVTEMLHVAPFSTRMSDFAHYVDTRLFSEELWDDPFSWPELEEGESRTAVNSYHIVEGHPQLPACGELSHYIIADKHLPGDSPDSPISNPIGVTGQYVPKIWLELPYFIRTGLEIGPIALHELGHTIGGLLDEYLYETPDPSIGRSGGIMGNCISDTRSYLGYGDTSFQGCSIPELYRPSETSIMSRASSRIPLFNVKGCGNLLRGFESEEEQQRIKAIYADRYEGILPPSLITAVSFTHWYDECCALPGVLLPSEGCPDEPDIEYLLELAERFGL